MKRAPYLALSATFMDDPAIVEAGERAAWLYLAMACDCRLHRTDGTIAPHRIERLGVQAWKPRLDKLIEVGLVERQNGHYVLPAYLKWNASQTDYQRRSHQGRIDVCGRHHEQPCAHPRCQESAAWLAANE